MRESSTYQGILDEGRQEGEIQGALRQARKMLLSWGKQRIGTPDPAVVAAVQAITDLERLERMCDRLFELKWPDLLATR